MGTIKAVLGVLLIIGAVYSGFQIIPPELSNYSYQDDLKNIAMMAGANPHRIFWTRWSRRRRSVGSRWLRSR